MTLHTLAESLISCQPHLTFELGGKWPKYSAALIPPQQNTTAMRRPLQYIPARPTLRETGGMLAQSKHKPLV